MDFASSFSGFGDTNSVYNSGPADGNYPGAGGTGGGMGMPNISHSATIVAFIVIAAVVALVFGVIGLRASGEVVI